MRVQEKIARLRELVRKCYATVAGKNGTVPEVGERTMENLPDAIASTHDTLEELTITQNGEYTPQEGVDGFSKVTAKFDTSSLPKVKVTTFLVNNNCINDDGIWEGEDFIDTSECTTFETAFRDCGKLKKLKSKGWCTSKVTKLNSMFAGCDNLVELDVRDWDTSNVVGAYFFVRHSLSSHVKIESIDFTSWDLGSLTNIYAFPGWGNIKTLIGGRTINDVLENNISIWRNLKISLQYLYQMKFLDRASLRAIINGLADLTGQTTQTLTLGATLIAKLTEEDIAIATNKNWTLS